ncbi:MAG: D-2-hydroxyacid dehydrogenase [Betaproteobacteria bacterium]
MTALLLSHRCNLDHGPELSAVAARAGHRLDLIVLPPERGDRLGDADCARVEAAFFSGDVYPEYSRQFFSAARKAPNLKWLHVFNAGVDHPIYSEMQARGVRLTTSSGSTAAAIAQTAIAALLMLARNFPHWLEAQRERAWRPMLGRDAPRDLEGQTALVLGLGHIGKAFARIAKALGLHVIGVRRSARPADDAVDELHPPGTLPGLLPRVQWLVVACPLTPETRGLIDADALARLPQGARVINIARGEILDEPALIAALENGHLGGAYLDVFEKEPLPPESPLWGMPNVFLSPHNSAVAEGNDRRVYEIFRDNLARWMQGAPLVNEVRRAAN